MTAPDPMAGTDLVGFWHDGELHCRWCRNQLASGSGAHICAVMRTAARNGDTDAQRCLTRMLKSTPQGEGKRRCTHCGSVLDRPHPDAESVNEAAT